MMKKHFMGTDVIIPPFTKPAATGGKSSCTNSYWIDFNEGHTDSEYALYGLSSQLTVPSADTMGPGPGTLMLLLSDP
jgi:hypothetical protein